MSALVLIGIAIILVGFLVVFLGTVMSAKASEGGDEQTEARGTGGGGGGVVMIGPIPIIFGSDAKWTGIAIVLAIALMLIVLLSGVLTRQ